MNLREFGNKVEEHWLKAWLWVSPDGLLHIAISALIVLAFGWLRPLYSAVIIALVFGFLKEMYDVYKGGLEVLKHSKHDALCDVIGICFGLLLVWLNTLP